MPTKPLPLQQLSGSLVLAGAGKMGGAMLQGWLAQGLDGCDVVVVDPHPSDAVRALTTRGIRINPPLADVGNVAVLVLAVKPQMFAEVAPQLRAAVRPSTLVLSVMAGVTRAGLQAACGGAVVRAMPNTPAAIGRGISVAVASDDVSAAQRGLADVLLRAAGLVEWIDDESLMDAVTAVSGSGPAYVFLLAEELAKAGIAAGLPAGLATTLARATVSGSGELLHRATEDAATLRQNVTSPNGTTAAALSVLMAADGLGPLMTRAVEEAARRSRELAS